LNQRVGCTGYVQLNDIIITPGISLQSRCKNIDWSVTHANDYVLGKMGECVRHCKKWGRSTPTSRPLHPNPCNF